MKDTTRTPHVDPAWAEAFIIELRLLDVRGEQIGAALADVEAHCADSGETAHDAFGAPQEYARELGLPAQGEGFTLREGLTLGAGLVGLFLTTYGAGAWGAHGQVEVTVGMLAVLAVVGIALSALLLRPAPVARAAIDRPWLLVLANVVILGGGAALLITLDRSLLSLPPLGVIVVGAALVAWEAVTGVLSRASGADDDPVVGPDGDEGVGTLQSTRGIRALAALGPWTMAIAALVLALLSAAPRLF